MGVHSGRRRAPDVLVRGGHYIHCGQVMAASGAKMRTIHGTSGQLPEALGVYLATRVLRCACGFQIEIPDQDAPEPA
jgi:hypothetical protein